MPVSVLLLQLGRFLKCRDYALRRKLILDALHKAQLSFAPIVDYFSVDKWVFFAVDDISVELFLLFNILIIRHIDDYKKY